jgi:hypothetical protein
MSDETTTPEAVDTPTETSEPIAVPPRSAAAKIDAPDGSAEKIVAELARERKARQAAERRVQEFEDASKSEAEKAAARAEAAEKALAEMTQRAMRLQVATETGLDPSLHEFLTGSDEESLRSQAEKLKAATASQRATPRPDPTQGAKPNAAGPTQLSKADLASMTPAQIDQALTEGRLVDVLAGRA